MDQGRDETELAARTRETQAIWDQKAAFWDQRMADGNAFHRLLVAPATERLLDARPGELVLDVACGNGQFARRLAAQGARVVACDFSAAFLVLARARTVQHAERIEYRLVDATEPDELLALGRERFDAALCSMALMDMSTVGPLLATLPALLRPGGRFVFSVLHPCFNSAGSALLAERGDLGGEWRTTYGVKVTRYLRIPAKKGVGMPGEPVPHYYFHRPLHELLGHAFRAGLVLDGLEEPAFEEGAGDERPLTWLQYTQIPPVLVARCRRL